METPTETAVWRCGAVSRALDPRVGGATERPSPPRSMHAPSARRGPGPARLGDDFLGLRDPGPDVVRHAQHAAPRHTHTKPARPPPAARRPPPPPVTAKETRLSEQASRRRAARARERRLGPGPAHRSSRALGRNEGGAVGEKGEPRLTWGLGSALGLFRLLPCMADLMGRAARGTGAGAHRSSARARARTSGAVDPRSLSVGPSAPRASTSAANVPSTA